VFDAFEAAGQGFCVDYVDIAASGLLMDPSGALATWGNFLTMNAAAFSGTLAACDGAGGLWNMIYGGCLQGGGDDATCQATATGAVGVYGDCMGYCGAMYGADDSDHDFNGVDGRLTMNFDIPCVGIIEAREVGDGTWFDRIVGIPGITATYMNPACGFNMPIYGDVSAVFEAMGMGFCVDAVGSAASGYLMDASLATWGNFMTANAATYAGTAASLTNLDPLAGDVDPAGIMVACGATASVGELVAPQATIIPAGSTSPASGSRFVKEAAVPAYVAALAVIKLPQVARDASIRYPDAAEPTASTQNPIPIASNTADTSP
jgi:hypothetical protein